MKLFSKNNLIKTIAILLLSAYAIITLINQQKKLKSFANTKKYYETKIEEQNKYNETLIETKDNLNSDEYVERIAREKLDMYYPNETIYLDVAQ